MCEDEIKITAEEMEAPEEEVEAPEDFLKVGKFIEVELEPVVEEEPKPKPKRKRKRLHVHVVKYIGTAKRITLSGVGKIYPGKEFEVSERIANTLKLDENFEVRTTYKYIEV